MNDERKLFNVNPISSSNPFSKNYTQETASVQHRLNGYDSGMLNENQFGKNEDFLNPEYKISEKQKEITKLSGEIKNAEMYGSQTEVLSLKARKHRLEKELADLNRQNASRRISASSNEIIEIPAIKKAQEFFSRKILSKVSKKFNSLVFLGDSMEKLSAINRSVDELIGMNSPYGERKENYEKLTQYLYQANKIHAEITKTMSSLK